MKTNSCAMTGIGACGVLILVDSYGAESFRVSNICQGNAPPFL